MSDEQTVETDAVASVSGTAATRELDVNKPFLWRVFRRDPVADVFTTEGHPVWGELGSLPHEFSFDAPSPQAIGSFTGMDGEYMLIHDGRVTFMRIAQTEPRFEEVEEGE